MTALFVADVHLSPERPATTAAFLSFLRRGSRCAQTVYILGDLFDLWLGDDDETPPHLEVVAGLKQLTAAGVQVAMVRGNHDFLLGDNFAARTGCRIISDPSVVSICGEQALVCHGDLLCTDDEEYQAFRRYTRDAENQRRFLSMPLAARALQADDMRRRSRAATELKAADIMDVNAGAVAELMARHRIFRLIHGHTHRPGCHRLQVGNQLASRIVLGDWYEQDSILVWDRAGPRLGRIADLPEAGY